MVVQERASAVKSNSSESPSKLKLLKKILKRKKTEVQVENTEDPHYRKERELAWLHVKSLNEQTVQESDAKAREALMTIVPPDLGRKR